MGMGQGQVAVASKDRPATRSELVYALGSIGAMSSHLAQACINLEAGENTKAIKAIGDYLKESAEMIAFMKRLSEEAPGGS